MLSFILTLHRMAKGILRSWKSDYFRSTLLLALLILASGTVFYRSSEGWSWIDSAYFCVMTATTVGYGDLAPTTPASRLFTIFYATTGIGVFVALVSQLAAALIKSPKKDD